MSGLEKSHVCKFWDNSPFDMEFVNASGRSGGILCVRDSSVFKPVDVIKDRNFLFIKGMVVGRDENFCCLNVYAPQGTGDKKGLWNRIASLKEANDGFLVSQGVMNKWLTASSRVLPRLILILKDTNFGHRPFRFFNSWLERQDFEGVVRSACENWSWVGPADVGLMKKFKVLRSEIKKWWDMTKVKEGENEQLWKTKLEKLEIEAESKDLNEEEDWVRWECLKELTELANRKTRDLKQSSRTRWALHGDENSAFFHGFIKQQEKKKFDTTLKDGWDLVPAKCNNHARRAEIDRLPTKGALERRNLRVSDNICALCEVEIRDLLELHKSIKLGDVAKEAFHRIIIIVCWSIWIARNDKVFEGSEVKVEDIIGGIKSLGFL
ncbi:uncharacterized protein LOC143569957 [Bidens hawaiensis]|uniref:uncharacterized protein LOC143569957 n=1 Tax=Bidens hawaiensis TaxID=980011 RepID=UPI004049527E